MIEGLLWFDADKHRNLAVKIDQAAARYAAKFGQQPDTCYCNPADYQDIDTNGVQVRTAANILKHHLWIGIEKARPVEYRQERLL